MTQLANMLDLFESLFGASTPPTGAYVEAGAIGARYTGETNLRSTLAQIARAHGWTVEEEVVVPGWGRVDLVLRDPGEGAPYLIELKLELMKPAKIRRAFQQADGYGRWWSSNHGLAARTYLVGAREDIVAIRPVAVAYPEVGYLSASHFMGALATWGNREMRARIAAGRADALRQQLELHEVAIRSLRDSPPTT